MNLAEAKEECQRWFDYIERQKRKSLALQELARERRAGTCSDDEMRRRMAAIDRDVKVFDGARLMDAVKFLLNYIDK